MLSPGGEANGACVASLGGKPHHDNGDDHLGSNRSFDGAALSVSSTVVDHVTPSPTGSNNSTVSGSKDLLPSHAGELHAHFSHQNDNRYVLTPYMTHSLYCR